MIEITLTVEEFWEAVRVAYVRFMLSRKAGLDPATTYERGYLTRLIEEVVGSCGEAAVGKWRGTPWGLVNTFHRIPDTGNIEVRATKVPSGRLIIRPWEIKNDPQLLERIFVLVTGEAPTLTLVGWALGSELIDDQWKDDPNGYGSAWFVPAEALHDMSTFPEPVGVIQ